MREKAASAERSASINEKTALVAIFGWCKRVLFPWRKANLHESARSPVAHLQPSQLSQE